MVLCCKLIVHTISIFASGYPGLVPGTIVQHRGERFYSRRTGVGEGGGVWSSRSATALFLLLPVVPFLVGCLFLCLHTTPLFKRSGLRITTTRYGNTKCPQDQGTGAKGHTERLKQPSDHRTLVVALKCTLFSLCNDHFCRVDAVPKPISVFDVLAILFSVWRQREKRTQRTGPREAKGPGLPFQDF